MSDLDLALEYIEDLKNKNLGCKGTVRRLIFIEKELKALEIIKEKRVDFDIIFQSECVEDYNLKTRNCFFKKPLTEEEFNLLKKVLQMNSLEFVAILKGSMVMNKDTETQFDKLEKELEVLEILKANASIVKDCLVVCITDDEIVKEWLENE